ncbi:Gx transporter family protein [uncultured Phascolarctobacterium sp.]|uniref:Gx transporter family protein n=1 Tax=uncultured Phascolarctobacterium sp. TaxID=512296 RepID=UPI0025D9367D|nr:Gx transporter family protein [uncultured Phascolarctobacterium sp.]
MRSSADPTTTTRTMLLLALLAALAVLLRLGENLLPLPVQLGGARPGLANTVTILCLYLFGLRLTGLFLTVRILLVGLLSTGLFTPGFCIGLGGTLLSLLLMEAGRRSQLFSPCGIGILGAAAHNTGQILTAAALLQSTALFALLPLLLLLALPFGLLTGAVAARVLPTLRQYLR